MKKIVSFVSGLSVLAACVSFNIAYASDAEITVGSVNAEPGQTIQVPITLANNPGILGMDLHIEYDKDALTLTKCELGDALSALARTPSANYNVFPFNIIYDGLATDDTSNGTMATLTFDVKDDANGSYEVKAYDSKSAFRFGWIDVDIAFQNGIVKVNPPIDAVNVEEGTIKDENQRENDDTYDKVYSYRISIPENVAVTPNDITVKIGNAIATKHKGFYDKIGALTGPGSIEFTSAITKIPVGETVTGVECSVSVSYMLEGSEKLDEFKFTLD